jgi:surfactin synthase thioesterase subunit
MARYRQSPWLVCWGDPETAACVLVGVSHAGAGAALFREWTTLVPREVCVCALRTPGRESRLLEPPLDRMDDLVAAATDALEPLFAGPLALFGHCSGAWIAFELAREARRRGLREPERLLVANQEPPARAQDGDRLPPDEVDPRALLDSLGGIDPSLGGNPELLALVAPAVQADVRLIARYEYGPAPPLDTAITAYVPGRGDLDGASVAGWELETTGSFALESLDATAFFVDEDWTLLGRAVAETVSPR